jgi:RNAse (barnase) inhibitor barstar
VTTITLTIDGRNIHDITSFYDEINRVFMAGESWTLGASLDALDDLFHGGYGAARGCDAITLIWLHLERSRVALGVEATRGHYRNKLGKPGFDQARVQAQLDELDAGSGPTYSDIVMEIIAAHPSIRLRSTE